MNESVPLEDFSALDDWLPEAPQWQPYRPQQVTRERQAAERADSAAG